MSMSRRVVIKKVCDSGPWLIMMKKGSGRVGAGAGLEPGQGSAGAGKKQEQGRSRVGAGAEKEENRGGEWSRSRAGAGYE